MGEKHGNECSSANASATHHTRYLYITSYWTIWDARTFCRGFDQDAVGIVLVTGGLLVCTPRNVCPWLLSGGCSAGGEDPNGCNCKFEDRGGCAAAKYPASIYLPTRYPISIAGYVVYSFKRRRREGGGGGGVFTYFID